MGQAWFHSTAQRLLVTDEGGDIMNEKLEREQYEPPPDSTYCGAWAAWYASVLGWPVLVLWWVLDDGSCACGNPACRSQGKHPIGECMPHGVKDATTDLETLARWFSLYPAANIGVATGKVSGMWVLDVDPRHGGDKALEVLIKRNELLPSTREAITGGGGSHFFFEYNGRVTKNSDSKVAPGLDVKADGGSIVVAPSRHKSGNLYQWRTPWPTNEPE